MGRDDTCRATRAVKDVAQEIVKMQVTGFPPSGPVRTLIGMTADHEDPFPITSALATLDRWRRSDIGGDAGEILDAAVTVCEELRRLRRESTNAEDRGASIEAATHGIPTLVSPLGVRTTVHGLSDESVDKLVGAILMMPDPLAPPAFDDFLDVLAWLTDDTDMRAIQITVTADLNAVTSGVDYRYVLKLDEHFGTDATGDTLDGVTTSYLGEGDTLDSASAAAMRQIVTDHQLRSV